MTAISRKSVKIYIQAADTDPSALADADVIEGEVKTYSQSGGNSDLESDPVFGGFVDKEKPREQVELSLEFIPSIGTNTDYWNKISYAVDTAATAKAVYTMASQTSTQPGDKLIVIEAISGTNASSIAYNNCNITELTMEHNADDNRTGNLTFKFSPESSTGVSNFMTSAVAATLLPAFSELNNNA